MAKRSRRSRHFVTKYPNHHVVVDNRSRRLTGKSRRLFVAIANKMLGETLIENQPVGPELTLDDLRRSPDDWSSDGIHNIVDRPAEMIGQRQSLRPLWHGKA